jgi:hypothetical protein
VTRPASDGVWSRIPKRAFARRRYVRGAGTPMIALGHPDRLPHEG